MREFEQEQHLGQGNQYDASKWVGKEWIGKGNYANHNCISYAEVDVGISGKGKTRMRMINNMTQEKNG